MKTTRQFIPVVCLGFTIGLLISHPTLVAGQKSPRTVKDTLTLLPQLTATIQSWPRGAVLRRNGKVLSQAKSGTLLKVGDLLTSPPNGDVDLRLGLQSTVRLKRNSRLLIVTLMRQSPKDPVTIDNTLRLDIGTLAAKLSQLKGQSRFIIETPSATTAAHGTSFVMQVGRNDTQVIVDEGHVGVTLASAKQQVTIGPNQKAVATATALRQSNTSNTEKAQIKEVHQLALPIAATVISGKGTVQNPRRGVSPIALKRGDSLYMGDVIATDKQSKIELQFADGSSVRLGKSSSILITLAKTRKANDSSRLVLFSCLKGEIIAHLRSGSQVSSGSATAEVRG